MYGTFLIGEMDFMVKSVGELQWATIIYNIQYTSTILYMYK